jgi:hypothetical protein
MPRELTPQEAQQKEFLKKVEMLSAVNLGTYEIHSRIALLWLQNWKELDGVTPEAPSDAPADVTYDWARLAASQIMGDYVTRPEGDEGAGHMRKARWLRDVAKEKGWTAKFEAGPVSIPINELSGYVNHAFTSITGFNMRLCDWRVISMFTSPEIWARSKIGDFVLKNGHEDQETLRFLELVGTKNLRVRIPVHVEAFTTEFTRYMREHMKHKWTPAEYFEWRKAFIQGLKIAGQMAPGRD